MRKSRARRRNDALRSWGRTHYVHRGRAETAAARRRSKTHRPSAAPPQAGEERPMSDETATISTPFPVLAKPAPAPAAARTNRLLQGPIFPTLLKLSAPNVLNLLAFTGMVTFDGFFLGRLGSDALAGASLV